MTKFYATKIHRVINQISGNFRQNIFLVFAKNIFFENFLKFDLECTIGTRAFVGERRDFLGHPHATGECEVQVPRALGGWIKGKIDLY